jgi:HEAT repeat protein
MAASIMTAGKAISILRSAIVNARIYPKGSQMIETALQGAHQAMDTCLKENPQIIVSDIQGKLCVNGKESPEARDFRAFMVQHDAQSIIFSKGVTLQEITTLIEGIGKRKGQLDGHKHLGEWLQSQGATHIKAEELKFVAVQKGEVVISQVLQLLEQSAGDTASLINSLEESYRLIDQLPDDKSKKEVQKQMAEHLSSLPPYQLKELFESKLPERVEQSGLREEVAQTLSREKLEETLEEVHKWYDQIKQEAKSDMEVAEKLTGLKSFLGKILHSPASKAVSFALYEELLNVGLLEEIPAGVQKGENSSVLAQVEHLLSMPAQALLEPAVRQKFPEVLKGLCAMGKDDLIQQLSEKIMENLGNPAPMVRDTAVKTLRSFGEVLASNRKERTYLMIVTALHKMAETESAPDVYSEITQFLQQAAMELLVNWKFEESAMILATLRRHAREESPIGQKKKQAAQKAIRDFSGRGLDVICADLNAQVKDRQNGAYKVLAELGEEAVGPLVEALKRSNDSRARQAAIQAMKRLGSAVKEPLLRQMNVGMAGDVLSKLVPLLEDFADVSLLPTLTTLQQHPDASVRREVLQLLPKVADPKAKSLIVVLLDDPDATIQTDAVRMVSELKVPNAISEILRRLLTVDATVQEEMCIALGRFGDRSAVGPLVKLAQNKSSFWKKATNASDTVRVRAVWALGQLLPDAEADAALKRATKDPAGMVQRAAQAALQKSAVPLRPAA